LPCSEYFNAVLAAATNANNSNILFH
jgi:hypothetical protein